MGNILYAFLVFGIVTVNVKCERIKAKTQKPIIGILAQEIVWPLHYRWPEIRYIAASYAKFVEGGGAGPVPIW